MYAFLADAVLVFHGLYIVFVVAGALLALRWPWMVWVHVPCAVWGALVELMGWPCPLTPLENRFRARAGEAGYEGGFIETYLMPLIYPGELTREIQLVLGAFVVVVNVGIYAWLIARRRGEGSRGP